MKRMKATVQEGIVADTGPGLVRGIEYQPGNGTRYCLLISMVPVEARLSFGTEPGSVRIDSLYGGSMFLVPGEFISGRYVAEKMGCGESDGAVLAELFAYLLGGEAEPAGPVAEGA